MNDVDGILLHQLRSIDAPIPADVETLVGLDPSVVVASVVLCLRRIAPGVAEGLATELPPSMSGKVDLTGRVAEGMFFLCFFFCFVLFFVARVDDSKSG